MNELWLLDSDTFDSMCKFHENNAQAPSVEELAAYDETFAAVDGMPRNMTIAGDRANIQVTGLLTDAPDFFSRFFGSGNTTFSSIITGIAIAEADPNVKEINLLISSPGGQASADWLDAMAAVANAKKPVKAFVGRMAASAAFGIATQANEIIAQNEMSILGSVGVVRSIINRDFITNVVSSNAPNKSPDASTDAGKAVIRKEIDAMEKIFIDRVAAGRDTTSDKVITDFGKGGIVLATEAVEKNMIDSIAGGVASESIETAAIKSGQTRMETNKMDLAKFVADHPAVYAQAVAVGEESGVEKGVAQERDRAGAHLILGESSGDMKTALAAVKNGDEMTATIQATYMAAGMNKKATAATTADSTAAGEALDGVDTNTNVQAKADSDKDKLKTEVTADICGLFDYEEETV